MKRPQWRLIVGTAVAAGVVFCCGMIALGQSSRGQRGEMRGSTGANVGAPEAAAMRGKIEKYLRNLNAWDSSFKFTFGELQPSSVLGLYRVQVEVSEGNNKSEATFYVSKDGRYLMRGDVEDMDFDAVADARTKIHIVGAPSRGPENAKVTLVIYEDFECPGCRQLETALRALLPNFPGVRVIYKDFPLTQAHPWAMKAAQTGRCVFKQNPDAFWKFHDLVFDNQNLFVSEDATERLKRYAIQVGVDASDLERCTVALSVQKEIQESVEEGRSLRVTTTPTTFINGRRVIGADATAIEHFIRFELGPQDRSAAH
jgi:protein-disulfide isomerase